VNKNLKTSLHGVVLGLMLATACALVGQPAQAQLGAQNGSRGVTFTPEGLAAMDQAGQLDHDAAMALHAGRYAEAEATERQSIALCPFHTELPEEVLAQALDAQGKEQEALQVYQRLVTDRQPRNLLPFALLLLKSGQWEQAVAAYNQATVLYPESNPVRANSHFSPDVLDATNLAVMIHIARGQIYSAHPDWVGEPRNTEAFAEYGKALQLAPNSDLANYYYGTGWQQLSPAERAKAGSVQQARAALQKAVKLGKGGVKKAAQKALLVAMKTK